MVDASYPKNITIFIGLNIDKNDNFLSVDKNYLYILMNNHKKSEIFLQHTRSTRMWAVM
jgi:hypothetical protein